MNDIDRQYFETVRPTEPVRPSFGLSDRFAVRPVMPVAPVAPKSPISNIQSSVPSPWKAGDRVSHRVFGNGTVVRVYRDEVTENDKIEIRFDVQGVKTLLLTHAKLERI